MPERTPLSGPSLLICTATTCQLLVTLLLGCVAGLCCNFIALCNFFCMVVFFSTLNLYQNVACTNIFNSLYNAFLHLNARYFSCAMILCPPINFIHHLYRFANSLPKLFLMCYGFVSTHQLYNLYLFTNCTTLSVFGLGLTVYFVLFIVLCDKTVSKMGSGGWWCLEVLIVGTL